MKEEIKIPERKIEKKGKGNEKKIEKGKEKAVETVNRELEKFAMAIGEEMAKTLLKFGPEISRTLMENNLRALEERKDQLPPGVYKRTKKEILKSLRNIEKTKKRLDKLLEKEKRE
jgi:uncharacterized membrane-anchored protein